MILVDLPSIDESKLSLHKKGLSTYRAPSAKGSKNLVSFDSIRNIILTLCLIALGKGCKTEIKTISFVLQDWSK